MVIFRILENSLQKYVPTEAGLNCKEASEGCVARVVASAPRTLPALLEGRRCRGGLLAPGADGGSVVVSMFVDNSSKLAKDREPVRARL